LYKAVGRDEAIDYANYQTALDVSDLLISDLRAILNGNGLGKFMGVPTASPWFQAEGTSHSRDGGGKAANDGPPKRQRLTDDADEAHRKTLGVLEYDTRVAGTTRLPTLNVYTKKKGGKTPERVCMKFLTIGYSCSTGTCKFPHVMSIDSLPGPEKTKLVAEGKKQKGLSWVAGRAPSGTSS
jgi:hypothetical protein